MHNMSLIIISLEAESELNRLPVLELGLIIAACITRYSVKTSHKTSSVHVAKLNTSNIFCSLTGQRQIMIDKVQRHSVPTLNGLLYFELSLNSHIKSIIIKAVQEFITNSKRFEN